MATKVKRFKRNIQGRDLIVGDVHGYFGRLQAALDAIAFDPSGGDRLFSVGDLVDRGPESDHALEWLSKPWFHAVAGNHEDLAMQWHRGSLSSSLYVQNGGAWNISNPLDAGREFAETFAALPIAIELETESGSIGIVHADCPFDSWENFVATLEDPQVSEEVLSEVISAAQWNRERIQNLVQDEIQGVRAVVVGHTPVKKVASLGNVLFIDTGGWLLNGRGHFSIVDAATLQAVFPR